MSPSRSPLQRRPEENATALRLPRRAPERLRRSPPSVAFRSGDDAAKRPNAARSSSSSTPSAGSSPTSRSRDLGQRARLVEAERVDGGQRLDRVQLLHQRAAARQPQSRHAVGQRGEQDQALGDERDEPGDRDLDRLVEAAALLAERDDQHHAERHGHADEHVEQQVQRPLQRRVGMAELPRLPGDALGVAVRADRLDGVGARALRRRTSRSERVAARARDGPRLAGQDRLVERETPDVGELPVGDDLVTGLHANEVALHDLLDLHHARLAVAHDRRVRRDERGQPVERPLGAQLLPDADAGVGDHDEEEERVAPVGEEQGHDAESDEHDVERRQHVRADDAGGRPAGGRLAIAPLGEPPRGLLLRQTGHRPRLSGLRPAPTCHHPDVPRLDAIGLIVADLQASADFYRLLGVDFPAEVDPEARARGGHAARRAPAHARHGGDHPLVRPELVAAGEGHRSSLAFLCDSPAAVDDVYRRVVEAGARASLEPWDAFWGQRYAEVVDPDGHVVHLFARLDPAAAA